MPVGSHKSGWLSGRWAGTMEGRWADRVLQHYESAPKQGKGCCSTVQMELGEEGVLHTYGQAYAMECRWGDAMGRRAPWSTAGISNSISWLVRHSQLGVARVGMASLTLLMSEAPVGAQGELRGSRDFQWRGWDQGGHWGLIHQRNFANPFESHGGTWTAALGRGCSLEEEVG